MINLLLLFSYREWPFFESSGFSIQDNISAFKIDKTQGMKSANGLLSWRR